MKNRIIKNIPIIILFTIIILTLLSVISIGVLSNKYLIMFIGIELLIFLIGFILYNINKKIPMIIGIIILSLSIIFNIFAYYYISKTNNYLDKNFKVDYYQLITPYYLVGKSSNTKNYENITNEEKIYYYKYSQSINKALDNFKNNNLIEEDEIYETLIKVDIEDSYFIISKADYEMFMDSSNLIFRDTYRIIYEFDVTDKIKINAELPDAYNVYINGMDYSGNRRDFNMIATINTKTHKILLTTMPRDYYIYIPAYDLNDSLTALGAVDSEISKEALEQLFGIKIDFTLNLYTESLVKLVDTIGGVEFCSKNSYYTTHDTTIGSYEDEGEKVYVSKGCKTYNGSEILAIARERLRIQKDIKREDNDRQIAINIIKKVANVDTLMNYNSLLNSLDGLYTSNINKRVITNLIQQAIEHPDFEIIEQRVDGKDTIATGYRGQGEVWATIPDMDMVNNAADKIKEIVEE